MTAGGYAKLFYEILSSSVWSLPDRTRLVWVTMLAMKDRDGIVRASMSGLARFANVPVEDAERAVQTLEGPDPDSRTPNNDGRRIEKIDGGWRVINHFRYRDEVVSTDPRAAADRERQRRFRDRIRVEDPGTPPTPPSGNTEKTDTDTDTDAVSRDRCDKSVTSRSVTLRGVTSRFDGETAKTWLEELKSIPGYGRISQVEADAVWMTQMTPHKANPATWALIVKAWDEFVLASLEKAYERPLKVWAGYIGRAVEGHGRPARHGQAPKKADHSGGF